MNNREVAQSFARGGSGSGSNFYTDGISIWSYGEHFKIARHYSGYTLFTDRDYSQTTAKHKSYTMSSLAREGLQVFTVPNCDIDAYLNEDFEKQHVENLRFILKKVTGFIEKYYCGRKNSTKQWYLMQANHYLNEAFLYAKLVSEFNRGLDTTINNINSVNLVNSWLIDNEDAIHNVFTKTQELINKTVSFKPLTFIKSL